MINTIKQLSTAVGLATDKATKASLMLQLANALLGTDNDKAYDSASSAMVIAVDIGAQSMVGEAYKIQGLCYYINSKPKEAMECFTQSIKIYTGLSDYYGMAGVTLNMGIVKMKLGAYPEALAFCEQALNLYSTDNGHLTGIAKSYNNIGVIYERTGEYVKALEMFEKSLANCMLAGDIKEAQNAEGNIALVYKSLGWNEQALEKMLQYETTYGDNFNKVKYCACLMNIGDIYVALNDLNKALEYFQNSLKLAKDIGHQRSVATSYTGLGKVLSKLGGQKEALTHYQKALEIFIELNEPDGICGVYLHMGSSHMSTGQYEQARDKLEKALKLALEHSFQHEQFEIYRSLATLYNAIGQPEDAAFMEAKSLPLRVLYKS